MESYGPVIPIWVQIIVVMLLIIALDKYDHKISIKLAGFGWVTICLFYLLIIVFKIEFLYNIISNFCWYNFSCIFLQNYRRQI